jgi:hypothetical protein
MKKVWQRVLVFLLVASGSLALGFYLGVRFDESRIMDDYEGLDEAQNSLDIIRAVRLLEGLRAGYGDGVIERLETQLDATITVGESTRQLHGTQPKEAAKRSLAFARNYRLQYPREDTRYFKRVNAILGIDPSSTAPTPTPNSP